MSAIRRHPWGTDMRTATWSSGVLAERWRVHYNTVRPHSSPGYKPPTPEAWLTSTNTGHGEVESKQSFPLPQGRLSSNTDNCATLTIHWQKDRAIHWALMFSNGSDKTNIRKPEPIRVTDPINFYFLSPRNTPSSTHVERFLIIGKAGKLGTLARAKDSNLAAGPRPSNASMT
jgi:hypothetical protein